MCCKHVKQVGPLPPFAREKVFSRVDTPFALYNDQV